MLWTLSQLNLLELDAVQLKNKLLNSLKQSQMVFEQNCKQFEWAGKFNRKHAAFLSKRADRQVSLNRSDGEFVDQSALAYWSDLYKHRKQPVNTRWAFCSRAYGDLVDMTIRFDGFERPESRIVKYISLTISAKITLRLACSLIDACCLKVAKIICLLACMIAADALQFFRTHIELM